eukprot:CAMPEP_0114249644 /NCGR_PEP_ID=MMETSP0058-20121206/14260_1 /TAXON_ID=36894 /ORGANISM="Pyramimonas parkeae, CCMP726" /LENGTH=450 /DNA_ID=CAMNT_0001363219 /DNA_START=216 /DNA_END=1568 /DNA_ORIENTATION=+
MPTQDRRTSTQQAPPARRPSSARADEMMGAMGDSLTPYMRSGAPPVAMPLTQPLARAHYAFKPSMAPHKPRVAPRAAPPRTVLAAPRPTVKASSAYQMAFVHSRARVVDGSGLAKLRGLERAVAFIQKRTLSAAWATWLEAHVEEVRVKTRLRRVGDMFASHNARCKRTAWNAWMQRHMRRRNIKELFKRLQHTRLLGLFNQWKRVWEDGVCEADHEKAMRFLASMYTAKALNQWREVYLEAKAYKESLRARVEEMKHEEEYENQRAQLCQDILDQEQMYQQHSIVHVGYLVSGPVRCTTCQVQILVDELIVVQNYGATQCHLGCTVEVEKCQDLHLGMIEPVHMEQVQEVFMITRFISGAYRCDAQTSDGRYIRIEYITPQEEDSAEVLDEEVLQATHNGTGMGSFVAGAEDSASQGSDQASSDQKYVLERQQSWTTQEPDDDLLDEQY